MQFLLSPLIMSEFMLAEVTARKKRSMNTEYCMSTAQSQEASQHRITEQYRARPYLCPESSNILNYLGRLTMNLQQ